MEFTYRPLATWPGKQTARRQRAKFRARHTDTLALLDRELRHLGARSIVLQVALTEEQIRLDGRPRAGALPSHPGVVLSFESRHGPLSYPCDRFDSWEDNLRAIALALEALRAVDRYGVTRAAEQYRGWSALPPPPTPPPADPGGWVMTPAEAARLLIEGANLHGQRQLTAADWMSVYREAVKRTHPDRGGDGQAFKLIQAAREVLERHFGRG